MRNPQHTTESCSKLPLANTEQLLSVPDFSGQAASRIGCGTGELAEETLDVLKCLGMSCMHAEFRLQR